MAKNLSRGFSIIQILIGAVLLGSLAMAFVSFLNLANKGQKNVQNSVDFDILKTSLNLVFNTKACDGSLFSAASSPTMLSFSIPSTLNVGQNLFPAGVPKLKIGEVRHGSTPIVTLGKTLPGGLKIEQLEIIEAIYDGVQVLGSNPLTDTYHAFSSVVMMEGKKQEGSLGAKVLKTQISVRLLAQAGSPNQGESKSAEAIVKLFHS